MRRQVAAMVLVAMGWLVLAGCSDDGGGGGTDDATPTSTPTDDTEVADDSSTTSSEGDAGGDPAGPEVVISGFSFQPAVLEVSVGDTVTWSNEDGTEHTVTAEGGAFGESLGAGDRFEFTFEEAGSFAYFCGIHPDMTGEVVVS